MCSHTSLVVQSFSENVRQNEIKWNGCHFHGEFKCVRKKNKKNVKNSHQRSACCNFYIRLYIFFHFIVGSGNGGIGVVKILPEIHTQTVAPIIPKRLAPELHTLSSARTHTHLYLGRQSRRVKRKASHFVKKKPNLCSILFEVFGSTGFHGTCNGHVSRLLCVDT